MTHDFWYLSRSAGFTAYGLLFISTALGILIGTRLTGRFSRASMFDIHKFTAFLALAFSVVHATLLLGDAYFHFTLADLAVPLASPYRAWQTAAGVIAMYLTIIIVASFYVRHVIGYRAWRAIHFATFALFGLATLHGITAGSDTSALWARAFYLGAGSSVLLLTFYRVQHHLPAESGPRRMRYAASAAATFAAATLLLATGIIAPSSSDEGAATSAIAAQSDLESARVTLPNSLSALVPRPHDDDGSPYHDDDDDDEHRERDSHDEREDDD